MGIFRQLWFSCEQSGHACAVSRTAWLSPVHACTISLHAATTRWHACAVSMTAWLSPMYACTGSLHAATARWHACAVSMAAWLSPMHACTGSLHAVTTRWRACCLPGYTGAAPVHVFCSSRHARLRSMHARAVSLQVLTLSRCACSTPRQALTTSLFATIRDGHALQSLRHLLPE